VGTETGEAGPSLTEDLKALLEDGQTLVEAELSYQRQRVAFAWSRAKAIALLLVAAVFLAFFVLVAIVVGLLLALAPLVGAWGALAIVAVALAGLAATCFFSAVSRFRKARKAILGEPR